MAQWSTERWPTPEPKPVPIPETKWRAECGDHVFYFRARGTQAAYEKAIAWARRRGFRSELEVREPTA